MARAGVAGTSTRPQGGVCETDLVLPVHGWPRLTHSPSTQRATVLRLDTSPPQNRVLLQACLSRSCLQGSTTLHSSNSSSFLTPTKCSRLLRGINTGLWRLLRSLSHFSGAGHLAGFRSMIGPCGLTTLSTEVILHTSCIKLKWILSHAWVHSQDKLAP